MPFDDFSCQVVLFVQSNKEHQQSRVARQQAAHQPQQIFANPKGHRQVEDQNGNIEHQPQCFDAGNSAQQ
jgi:hypothetical protein